MKNPTMITNEESIALLDLINHPSSRPREDTVGARHNPTTRTTAHVTVDSDLFAMLKRNGWLESGTVLVCHHREFADEFRIEHVLNKWSVSHLAVG